MTELPSDWERPPLGQVARITAKLVDPSGYPHMPHIAPNHIERGTGRLLPYRTISEDGVTSPKYRFRTGEVLYSKIRPYLAKATLARFDGLCSADMYPLTTDLNPGYLTYWLISPMFTALAASHQGRSVLPKINREALFRIAIPVPPLPEQGRIVGAIEEQLSRLEAAEEALRRSKERLDLLRDSIVEDAFASHTEAVPLGELAASVTDGPFGSNLKSSHYTSSGPRVIRLANIGDGVFVDKKAHISAEHFRRLQRYSVREGDVVVASLGGNLPRSCVVPAHALPAIAKADCIRVRFDADVNPRFVSYALQRPSLRRRARQLIHGVGRPRLGLPAIRSLEVPVASTREQAEIVELIDQRLSLMDIVTQEVEDSLARCGGVRRAVLSEAFAGRLVPQALAHVSAPLLSAEAGV